MGKSIISFLTSCKTSIALLLIYASLLALATVIEKFGGTSVAKIFVYYSPLSYLLYILIVANFFAVTIKRRLLLSKKWGFLLVHLSFVVILTGALVTHVFGEEGVIHLRQGETTGEMVIQTNRATYIHQLPFQLELVKFTLKRYPGSSSPSSYESSLIVHVDGQQSRKDISMNNVLDIKGYRLFQASYDKDEQGSLLSVNKDVAGRGITYTGYLLLTLGFILCFTGNNTRFRKLASQLKEFTKPVAIMLLLLPLGTTIRATETEMLKIIQEKQIDKEHAALFGSLPLQSTRGKIEPINTFSSEVLRKLHHAKKIGKLKPDQFLLSLIVMPEMWTRVPLIAYSNKEISFNHDLTEQYCAYIELFDSNGNYKLESDLTKAFSKPPNKRTTFEKDLIKLDEQINIFHQLINLQMINLFPIKGDETHKWYSPGDKFPEVFPQYRNAIVLLMQGYRSSVLEALKTGNWQSATNKLENIRQWQNQNNTLQEVNPHKLKAERIYNKVDIFKKCQRLYLAIGGCLLLFCVSILFNNTKRMNWLAKVMAIHIWVILFLHLAGIITRWYIAGYAPWSNSYETMVLLSFLVVCSGMFFSRTTKLPLALATLLGGVILFVSGLNWMNPQITPLVPVLKSPWLMIHVAVIMAAYGFFGISCLFGITNLVLLRIKASKESIAIRIKELTIMNEMSLLIGLAFMTIGVFVGAIWANESWGRYWGWDPKETWALITIVVYVVATHLHLVKKWDNVFLFNLVSVIAFASVIMTYFGVNYLLNGMHSYN